MTTNAPSVKNYKAVDDVMNGAPKNGVEMRKRKESLAKRQQSFIRQDSCGVVLERPLTREDLRKSFARSNTISSASADTKEGGEEWKEKGEGASATRKVQPLRKSDRKESLKQIKQGLKEGVQEVKEVVKENIAHLPDGHRGSIASVTERPRYKLLDKQTKQTEL